MPIRSASTHFEWKVTPVNKRFLLRSLIASSIALMLAPGAMAQDKPIKVGVTAGPHAQIFEQVRKVAEKDGLKIQIVEFSDYVQPNAALAAGDLDANSYQHKPYLDAQVKDRGYKLVSAGYTVNFPIGLYSKKVKKLEDLKEGARFGIPNDPTNGGRVLLVLQDKGLIKLKDGAGLKATPLDVTSNPKKLKFVELDAAQARPLAGRPGCRRDQHQLRPVCGPQPQDRCHRPGKRQEPLCEHHRRARVRQGQALGGQAREGLPLRRDPPVHRHAVQGCGARWLVRGGAPNAPLPDRQAAPGP